MTQKSSSRAALVVVCLVAVVAAVGCGGSSKPSYCGKVDDLRQSVGDLANVKVVQNGTSSLRTAVDKVRTDSSAAVDALKSDFPDQTKALTSSIDALVASASALSSSPATALPAIPGEVSAVATAVKNLRSATQSKCS